MASKQRLSDPDPDVRIPAAVRAAAARSEELMRAVNGPAEGEDQGGDKGEGQGENQNKDAGQGNGGEQGASSGGDQGARQDQEGKKPAQEVTSPGNQIQQPAPKPEGEETWEHRYKSMKGRHDRAIEHIGELSSQVSNLQRIIATLNAASPQKDQQPRSPDQQFKKLITPEEEAEYGPEFLGVVERKAQELVERQLVPLQQQIQTLEGQLGKVGGYVASNARTRMEEHLTDKCPTWREINVDPNFLQWLKLPDAYSGVIRHELLKSAYERNDAPRVLNFFNGFLAEEAAVAPQRSEPDPAPLNGSGKKVPLENFAAPGRAKSAAGTPPPPEKPIITRSQISKFYAEVAAGKYLGNDKEKNRLEQMIFAAEKEGRIQ